MTSFGESHGAALGVVVEGCPSGLIWNEALLKKNLNRRRPGLKSWVSARAELDVVEVLSGVYEGKTLGTPIAMIVRNVDARSEDYQDIAKSPRPGHADDVWRGKFAHVDPRGGGRSSGRETVSRVMAASVAQMFLSQSLPNYSVHSFAHKIGPFELSAEERGEVARLSSDEIDELPARFPSPVRAAQVQELLESAKVKGESFGGVAELWIEGVPAHLGQPVFRKLKADLAAACMSVGATIGVEFGEGFAAAGAEGTHFHANQLPVYGGIRGGLSTGERIVLRVAFKPTSSVLDVSKKGRHDPCIVPRALPVLEAMVHLVLAEHLLWQRLDRMP